MRLRLRLRVLGRRLKRSLYEWFWKDFLCRTEQFTDQFIRMAKKWPLVWVLVPAAIIVFFGWYSIVKLDEGKWWWMIGFTGVVVFVCWLLLHLGGFC